MTTLKLTKVAEHPARASSGDRVLFTDTRMWVVYVAEDMSLTLAEYDRLAITTLAPSPIRSSSLVYKVSRDASPCILVIGTQIAVIYQTVAHYKRSLVLLIVDSSHNIVLNQVLSENAGYEIPFACFIDSMGALNVLAGQVGFTTHEHTTLLAHTVGLDYSVFTRSLDIVRGSLASVTVSRDKNDLPVHIIYATNIHFIYRIDISPSFGLPTLLHQCGEESIVELTAMSNGLDSMVIYSALVNGKPFSPRFYHVLNDSPAVELSMQAGEAASHCRISYIGVNSITGLDIYNLYFITQAVSAHPYTLFATTLENPFPQAGEIPTLTLVDYRRPFDLQALSLALGQSLQSDSALQEHIQAGSILLRDPESPNSWLCYFDPEILSLSCVTNPSSIVDQPRGLPGHPSTQLVSVESTNPEGLPLQYIWSSSSSEITFSNPYSISTTVYFSYLAPETALIQVQVLHGNTPILLGIPVTLAQHQSPSFSPFLAATLWHTPVMVSVPVSHDKNYPITLTCSAVDDIAIGFSRASLARGQRSYTYQPTPTPNGSLFTVWLQPWHVSVLGASVAIDMEVKDALGSVMATGHLEVDPFPMGLLGDGYLKRYQYTGDLRTANDGLGYIAQEPMTGLLSDFTDVKRLIIDSVLYFVFMGKHTVLWISNWATGAHIYLVSYSLIKSSAINKYGATAILTDGAVLVYNPISEVFALGIRDKNPTVLPPNFTYQDVPNYIVPLPRVTSGAPVAIKETSLKDLWVVATTRAVGVLTKQGLDMFDSTDLFLGPEDELIKIYTENVIDAVNGYVVVIFKVGSAYMGVEVNLTNRGSKVVWRGESLAAFVSI